MGVPPGADPQTIKQAFRREIARYHPDKVTHLGVEFQQLAAARAAELTAAYNTLSNEALRAEYDAQLGDADAPAGASPAPAAASASGAATAAPVEEPEFAPAGPRPDRFQQERAHRDDILRRAMLTRLRDALAADEYEAAAIPGFELSLVPRARPAVFRRSSRPPLLVRLVDRVDAGVTMQAWTDALRARLTEKPVVLLLLGREVDRVSVREVVVDRQRKHPKLAEAIVPVAMTLGDGVAELPLNTAPAVATLVDRVRNFIS